GQKKIMEEKKGYTARELAVLLLCRLERQGKYGSLEADSAIKKFNLKGAEKALYTKLFYGVLERRITLDHIISKASDKPLDCMTLEMKNILRVSAYQLLYLDRVPDYSVVNEGAELAKKYERLSAAGFANAVLRRIAREGMPDIKREKNASYLSVKYSVSEQICGLLINELGFDEAKKMLASLFKNRYLTLRVNTLKTSVAELKKLLEDNGISSERIPQSDFGLKLCDYVDTAALFEITGDLAYIEDGASQAAITALDARPGMTVADVCAAPGGKTVSAAIQMENKGEIYAFDIHKNKLKLIDKTAEKLGINIIRTAEHDGREPLPELKEKCDRVICDVPCSGLGVLGQKPDMRYKEIFDTERLISTQRAILQAASTYLKKDGVIVYSTCTVLSDENKNNVREFLNKNGDFELTYEKTFYPHTDGVEGFYIAKMRRK
ncbi:MAG: 16S rRNA (cytosine(967)-C(5))-methyltransferase RsmB, partial [Clostridia bacterium]|nr:16S rRNA (cytosine(967)-C(5))-methyltransferase RsmB [Clostridia bacterium]